MRLSYTHAVQEVGGLAVVLPAHGYVDDTNALLDRVDGLLFSGAPDLDPAVYGQGRHTELGPDVDRVVTREITSTFAAAGLVLLLAGLGTGLRWRGRLP